MFSWQLHDFQDALADTEAKSAGEKAALKRAHKETKHRLRHCEAVLDELRSKLTRTEADLEQVRVANCCFCVFIHVVQVRRQHDELNEHHEQLNDAYNAAMSELDHRVCPVGDGLVTS